MQIVANMKKRARSKSRTKPDVTGKNKANSKKRSPWEVLRPPPEAVLLPSEIVVEQPPPFRRALPQLDDIESSFVAAIVHLWFGLSDLRHSLLHSPRHAHHPDACLVCALKQIFTTLLYCDSENDYSVLHVLAKLISEPSPVSLRSPAHF